MPCETNAIIAFTYYPNHLSRIVRKTCLEVSLYILFVLHIYYTRYNFIEDIITEQLFYHPMLSKIESIGIKELLIIRLLLLALLSYYPYPTVLLSDISLYTIILIYIVY